MGTDTSPASLITACVVVLKNTAGANSDEGVDTIVPSGITVPLSPKNVIYPVALLAGILDNPCSSALKSKYVPNVVCANPRRNTSCAHIVACVNSAATGANAS